LSGRSLRAQAGSAARLLFGAAPADAGTARYQVMLRGFATAAGGKGLGVVTYLVSVPLTLQYLGAERYGVWIAISGILGWLSIADLGLGNGLMNLLFEARGKGRDDLAREYVSCAFGGLTAIVLVIGTAAFVAAGAVDWSYVLNLQSTAILHELPSAVALGACLFLLNLPLSLVGKIYITYQQGTRANMWAAIASLAGLAGIFAATRTDFGITGLIAGFFGSQTLVLFISAAWLFAFDQPALRPTLRFRLVHSRRVFGTSGLFFLNQLQSLLVFQTDVIILSHFLGPAAVTPYSVAYRLISYVNLLQQLASPFFLSAVGEAHARGETPWIARALKRFLVASLLVAMPLVLLLVVFREPIIGRWAGEPAVPSFWLAFFLGIGALMICIGTPMFLVLSAARDLRRIVAIGYIAALANLALAITLVRPLGSVGIAAAAAIVCGVCIIIPYQLQISRYFRRAQDAPVNP
jgi:O-antigen/teichoic acid export membrane protein